jgi:hypothetical protein
MKAVFLRHVGPYSQVSAILQQAAACIAERQAHLGDSLGFDEHETGAKKKKIHTHGVFLMRRLNGNDNSLLRSISWNSTGRQPSSPDR